jgi:hypothetical protein
MRLAHTLSRMLFWSQNILWKQDLMRHHATVFLGGKDSIINAPLVHANLQAGGDDEGDNGKCISIQANYAPGKIVPESGQSDDGRLNVGWCANLPRSWTGIRSAFLEETVGGCAGGARAKSSGGRGGQLDRD